MESEFHVTRFVLILATAIAILSLLGCGQAHPTKAAHAIEIGQVILLTGEAQRQEAGELSTALLPIFEMRDASGKSIMPQGFDELYVTEHHSRWNDWYGDYLVAERGGQWGVVDISGNVIVPIEYGQVCIPEYSHTSQQVFVRCEPEGRLGLWHTEHGKITEPEYDEIFEAFYNTESSIYLFAQKDTNVRGIYDILGTLKLKMESEDWVFADCHGSGRYVLQRGDTFYWLDCGFSPVCQAPKGLQVVHHNASFSMADFMGEYLFFFDDHGGCGLIDASGGIALRLPDGDMWLSDDGQYICATTEGRSITYTLDLKLARE